MLNMVLCKRYLLMVRLILSWGGYARAEYLRKIGYFASMGEHCYMQPINYGTEPWLISFGNNVFVASGVRFFTHDYTAGMFRYMDPGQIYQSRLGKICIGNNVFIGGCSTILYDVNIGDCVIIGAGSLVNCDIPSGSVAAGVPCKVIGKFEDYQRKIREMSRMAKTAE